MNPNEQNMHSEVPSLILNIWNAVDQINEEKKAAEASTGLSKVTIRPNPFSSSITIELGLNSNEHVIVRMTDSKGTILRLFGWHLITGTNVTSISGLNSQEPGEYLIEVLNHLGVIIFKQIISKV